MKLQLNDLFTYQILQFLPYVEQNTEEMLNKFPVLRSKVQTKGQFLNNWVSRDAPVPKRVIGIFGFFLVFIFKLKMEWL